jgi:hypothetical protein
VTPQTIANHTLTLVNLDKGTISLRFKLDTVGEETAGAELKSKWLSQYNSKGKGCLQKDALSPFFTKNTQL